MPRPPRAVPPPARRRPVAGTRGRRPSGDPLAGDGIPDGPTRSGAPDKAEAPASDSSIAPAGGVADPADTAVREAVRESAAKVGVRPPGPKPKASAPSPTAKPAATTSPGKGRRPDTKPTGSVARPGPGPSPEHAGRAGRRAFGAVGRHLPVTGLILAVVLLLAATVALGAVAWQARRTADAGKAAVPAARSYAKEILSYDYRRIDADIARAKKDVTGSFRADYADTSKLVKPLSLQYHVIVVATVKAASVVSAGPDKVVVLLFVDQETTSTRIAGPKIDQSRVRMTLVRSGGTWLVAKVDAL